MTVLHPGSIIGSRTDAPDPRLEKLHMCVSKGPGISAAERWPSIYAVELRRERVFG